MKLYFLGNRNGYSTIILVSNTGQYKNRNVVLLSTPAVHFLDLDERERQQFEKMGF